MTKEELKNLTPGALIKDADGDRAVYLGKAHGLISDYSDPDDRVFQYINPPYSEVLCHDDIHGQERRGWMSYAEQEVLTGLEVICEP